MQLFESLNRLELGIPPTPIGTLPLMMFVGLVRSLIAALIFLLMGRPCGGALLRAAAPVPHGRALWLGIPW